VAAAVALTTAALQFVTAIPAHAAVAATNPSVTEPGDAGLTRLDFVVTRALGDPTTIDYQTVPETGAGKATEGRDYLPADGTLVFAAAELEKHVRVDVIGDTLNEGDETVTLRLSNNAVQLAVATGTIHDDNDPAPAVSVADTAVGEGNSGTTEATFSVTLNRPSGRTVTVGYATANGSAGAPADFTATTGSLTFDPGDLSETVTVPVAGDVLDEADETFTLTLTDPATNATIGRGAATGRILDDDEQPVASITGVTVAENAGPANFKVSLSAASGREVTVHATTVSGTAFPGSDFEGRSGAPVTIPAGATEATFPVPLVNDDVNESTETFSVELSAGSNALVPPGTTATGTITDDDPGPKLSINDVSIVEGALNPMLEFTVSLAGAPSGQVVTVAYTTVDGTAKSPADYGVSAGLLTFTPGITTQHVRVTVVNDPVKELDENFTVKLSAASNAEIADDTGLGTIQNDDGPPAILSVSDPTVAESAGKATFTVSISGPVAQPVLVNYQTRDASARAPRDYDSGAGTITFAPNDTAAKTVDVPVTADGLDEVDETFTFELSDPINAAFTDGVGTATITDDDDAPTVIVDTIPPIDEGDSDSSSATVDVRLSAESGKEVRLNYTVVDGTATAGADYTAPANGQLVFSPGTLLPGETVEHIPVAAVGDRLYEGNETFLIRFASADANASVPPALAAPNGATVTIADNDPKPTVGIYDADVEEPPSPSNTNTFLRFPVRLSAPSGRNVTVTVTDTDGTAAEGTDYNAPPATLTITAGQQGGHVSVQVKGDSVVDSAAEETFTVTLSNPQDAVLDPAHTMATGTIYDEDGAPTLRITGTTVSEGVVGEKATVTVDLFPSSSSSTPITVDYATSDGTARAPADYTAASGTLTFTAGQTVKTFDVAVVPDAVDELDENFTVSLSNESAGAAVARRSDSVAILDDDGPVISVTNVSIMEGNTGTRAARFLVSLSATSPQAVSVTYATSSGTASSPADFVATSGSLTFAPGEIQKPVDVPVVGDVLDEADEDFTLALGTPVNATAGPPGRGTIIDDDQPNVTVAASVTSPEDPVITEGDVGIKTMTFAVRLDAPTTRDVVVDYATADGTATAGVDYLSTSGRLTFAPGEVSKNVLVAILGDARDEVDETVALRLPSAVNGTIIDAATLGTILDDDNAGYALVATDGGMFTFGGADFFGSTGSVKLNQPIVGMAPHPSGRGYWLVAADGGIFTFGEAGFYGSTGAVKLNKPIVGMAATPSGNGYWLVATDGGIFSFGDAAFHGSTGAVKLNKPVVGMASTPSGKGYWLVATDGGIFTFGDAAFQGSTGALKLNQPIVGMASTTSGKGYWLVATDGGIFTFGDAKFHGSTGAVKLNRPIVGMAPTPSGNGYWLVADDGGIFTFGDAEFLGSTGAVKLNKPVVGMAVL
jgi:hypothetical protein